VQLKSTLGFFVTLDPLGFHDAQYMVLYMVLGEMLVMGARSTEAKELRESKDQQRRQHQQHQQQFDSEWARWLVDDFTSLCAAVLPKARRYLRTVLSKRKDAAAGAAGAASIAEVDLIEEFLAGPAGRSKGTVPNLLVVVGWQAASVREREGGTSASPSPSHYSPSSPSLPPPLSSSSPSSSLPISLASSEGSSRTTTTATTTTTTTTTTTAAAAATTTTTTTTTVPSPKGDASLQFDVTFVEELWRRNLSRYYKYHPAESVDQLLEQLLYGPAEGTKEEPPQNAQGTVTAHATSNSNSVNTKKEDRMFAEYAQLRWGTLPKSRMQQAKSVFGANGETPPLPAAVAAAASSCEDTATTTTPSSKGGGDSGGDNGSYRPRQLAEYHKHSKFFDTIVQAELLKIEGMNMYLSPLFQGKTLGRADYFGGEVLRAMLVQALQYRGKAAMKHGVTSGEYKNTFSFIVPNRANVNRNPSRRVPNQVPKQREPGDDDDDDDGSDDGSQQQQARGSEPASARTSHPPGISLELMSHIHTTFEKRRQESWKDAQARRLDLEVARCMVACRDPLAFAGRLMAACPTRGGGRVQLLRGLAMRTSPYN